MAQSDSKIKTILVYKQYTANKLGYVVMLGNLVEPGRVVEPAKVVQPGKVVKVGCMLKPEELGEPGYLVE